jgi:glycosyltransferase involved in cell wall biosynthesis
VITSNRSSLPEVGGDAACYVDPDDIDAMAAAIRRVAGDAALRASLREKGLRQARRFSWDAAARATLEVYRSLI